MKENKIIRDIIRNVINEAFINEGVYDKNIFKAFFLGGGPGSGKSYMVGQLFGTMTKDGEPIVQSLSGMGLKVFNVDHAFESELKKRQINMKNLANLSAEDKEKEIQARDVAIRVVNKMWEYYKEGRLGMIIDATSQNALGVLDFKNELERIGYDTYMIYISTNLRTCLLRNQERERVLPDKLVKQVWDRANLNKQYLSQLFNNKFIEIDNNRDELNQDRHISEEVKKNIKNLIEKPIENPIALEWIKNEKEIKNRLKLYSSVEI